MTCCSVGGIFVLMFLQINPPFAPPGTITAFLTFCALVKPSISVRKSSFVDQTTECLLGILYWYVGVHLPFLVSTQRFHREEKGFGKSGV